MAGCVWIIFHIRFLKQALTDLLRILWSNISSIRAYKMTLFMRKCWGEPGFLNQFNAWVNPSDGCSFNDLPLSAQQRVFMGILVFEKEMHKCNFLCGISTSVLICGILKFAMMCVDPVASSWDTTSYVIFMFHCFNSLICITPYSCQWMLKAWKYGWSTNCSIFRFRALQLRRSIVQLLMPWEVL